MRRLQAKLAPCPTGNISVVKSEVISSENSITPAKRKRGKKPKDVISYRQMNLSPYLSTDRPVKVAGRRSRSDSSTWSLAV